MSEAEDIAKIVEALKKVPEKYLLIIDLARESVNGEGELDYDYLADKKREVNLAVAEAKAYGQATKRAIESLSHLPARQGGMT